MNVYLKQVCKNEATGEWCVALKMWPFPHIPRIGERVDDSDTIRAVNWTVSKSFLDEPMCEICLKKRKFHAPGDFTVYVRQLMEDEFTICDLECGQRPHPDFPEWKNPAS